MNIIFITLVYIHLFSKTLSIYKIVNSRKKLIRERKEIQSCETLAHCFSNYTAISKNVDTEYSVFQDRNALWDLCFIV